MHCPGGNAIWTDLKSAGPLPTESLAELLLKPQHSNPNPNSLANQLWLAYSSHTSQTFLTNSLPSLNLYMPLKKLILDSCKMVDKPVWSIPYVSVEFFPSFKTILLHIVLLKYPHVPDCIFEIHQVWQSGFSGVYSNSCRSCSFEPEIIRTGQSSHKMYSNNIVNFQESMTILNACTKKKKSGNLLKAPRKLSGF